MSNKNFLGKDQKNFHELMDAIGEKAANQEIARQLRWMADHIEGGQYPIIFGVELPLEIGTNNLKNDKSTFFREIVVTLSYPWGG